MDRYFRLYLTIILIIFTLIFSGAIGFYDYYKGQQKIHSNHEKEIEMIGNAVVESLHTIDQVYNLTDDIIGKEMEEKIEVLLAKYEENPSFEEWDFQRLKEQFGMDVFVIDENNTVIYSSFLRDIGLNFNECCSSFAKTLEARRLSGQFKHDNIDLQQASGEIRKFGYIPTPDQKYLLELSMSLEEDPVFKRFDFIEKINQLEKEYVPIHTIRVYNPTGIMLGYTDELGRAKKISEEMRQTFDEVAQKNEERKVTKSEKDSEVTYRYIPYIADEHREFPMKRIVEIVYSEAELDSLLKFYRDGFFYQQLIIIFVVILFATIIGRILSKPVHFAFHDSLTGLKNRASFEMDGNRRLARKNEKVTLIMIDIDNFKRVNDELGHRKGDQLLVNIAKKIEGNMRSESTVARLGGDEFVILCSNSKRQDLTKKVENLIAAFNKAYADLNANHHLDVSISAGIADAREGEDLQSLYERVDQALYHAKESGKNQYKFFEEN